MTKHICTFLILLVSAMLLCLCGCKSPSPGLFGPDDVSESAPAVEDQPREEQLAAQDSETGEKSGTVIEWWQTRKIRRQKKAEEKAERAAEKEGSVERIDDRGKSADSTKKIDDRLVGKGTDKEESSFWRSIWPFGKRETADTNGPPAETVRKTAKTPGRPPKSKSAPVLPDEQPGREPDSVSVAAATNMAAGQVGEPQLRPGLALKVVVMASGKKEVDEESKRVSSAETITLPLVGSVKVGGMTVEKLRIELAKRYAEYLHNPMVDVEFVVDKTSGTAPWGFVTVLGRVKEPGRINIPPTRDLSLSMAIQLAGGLDTSAKLSGIKITRENDDKLKHFSIDLQSVGSKGQTEGDIVLQANDIVYVPQRVF